MLTFDEPRFLSIQSKAAALEPAIRRVVEDAVAGGARSLFFLGTGGAAILMCDSSVPSCRHGLLDAETLRWIATTLDDLGGTQPVLIAFHHTPVAVHHPLSVPSSGRPSTAAISCPPPPSPASSAPLPGTAPRTNSPGGSRRSASCSTVG